MAKRLNEYRDEAYAIAVNHGWHDEEHSDEHWKCLIISELMEAVAANRNSWYRADVEGYEDLIARGTDPKEAFERRIKDTVDDELADACIRIFDLAGLRNVTLWVDHLYGKSVTEDKFFTENIYAICQKILLYNNSLYICLNQTLKQIFRLAKIEKIDLYKSIELKMEYNKLREYKHGKKY